MKNLLAVLAVLALASSSAEAQSPKPLAGTSLRLVPKASAPANLTGRAGLYNKSGVPTWRDTTNNDFTIITAFNSLEISPSLVDASAAGFLTPQDAATDAGTGETWMVTRTALTSGIKFSWVTGTVTMTVKLWTCNTASAGAAPAGCSLTASASGTVGAGNGQVLSFGAPVTLSPYTHYATTMYSNNAHIVQTVGGAAAQAILLGTVNSGKCAAAGPHFLLCRTDVFSAAGGGAPSNAGGNGYYAEPVFVVN